MSLNQNIEHSQYHIPTDVLSKIITKALEQVKPQVIKGRGNGEEHKKLSQNWVKYFAEGLEKHYQGKEKNIISFFNQRKLKKNEPPVKEFLYDISVAEYDSFQASFSGNKIPFITRPIWQIESEFREDMNEIARDFQKLISGNAPYKMMVGPLGRNESEFYLRDMTHLARYVTGELYFLFITHPETWDKQIKWRLHKWGYWDLIGDGEIR